MNKSLRFMLLALLTLVCGGTYAQESLSEDFENLTLTDADGNALASSWSYGYGLSNGWKIVGGTIYGSASTTNYGYVKTGGKGHDGSNGYLEASYGSSNTASVWVSQPMPSDVITFWVKCSSTSSSTKGKVIIYEANSDGTVTTTKLFEETVTGGQAWAQKSVSGVNGKYIAINLVRAHFDDFESAAAVVEQKPDLNITSGAPAEKVNMNEGATVYVGFKNDGQADAQNVVLSLYVDGAVNNTAAIGTVAAGKSSFSGVAYKMEGITEGDHQVYLTLTADNDDTEGAGVKKTETKTVNFYTPVVAPTYSVTAENVTVPFGATSFEIKAVVKNTNNVASENLKVKLTEGLTQVGDEQTIASLAANGEQEVTFTVNGSFEPGSKTYSVYVNNIPYKTDIEVTFEEAPVAPVIDIALMDIRGLENINLKNENTVMVTFTNNSNVDVENATITLKMNGNLVGTETIAKGETLKSFVLPTEGLVAGETATLVATLSVENNKEGNTVELTKTLPIVSGEAAPAPVITLNTISSWEVDEAGEQTINVSVGVFNTGNADAEVTVKVYKDYGTDLDSKTVSVEKENGSAIASLSFTYDIQNATTFHVVAYIGTTPVTETQDFTVSVKQQVADLSLAKIADINATTEEDVKIAAVVKNNSAIAATDAKVGVYTQDENYQYQIVGVQQTVSVAANGEANVEFNLGKLAAGNYKYYVRIVTTDENMDNNMQDVDVKVSEPVAPVVNVTASAIQGISSIDLNAEANTISVWVKNEGNVAADAAISVTLNGAAVGEAQNVNVKADDTAYASFTLPTEGLTAGQKATVVATVTVAGNTAEVTTLTREYDVVDSSVATEPVFEIAAADVEVEVGAEKFNVVAMVKNTSTVAAENVEVKLFYNTVIATQTIKSLAAGIQTFVTFADVQNPFTKVGTYTMYVQAPKAQADVVVTVKEPAVEPVYDLALTLIQGTLDLAYETGNISVKVENHGNQDMTDAAVKLTVGETEYTKTVNVKAGEEAWAIFAVATEGLTAGSVYATASVEVENDATPADNTISAEITVNDIAAAEPTFSVTAENVSVPAGAEKFNIVAKVKNTSDVDATKVKVVLLNGINELETKTIQTLTAGAEKEVTFYDIEEILEPGKTATYFIQVANSVQTEVTVNFEEPEVEKTVDLAVSSINGTLSVEVETNYLTVYVNNLGTADVTGATVTLKAGEEVLGTGTVSAKAGSNGFCSIAVPATALQNGELTITATVEAEGDVDLTNNTLTKTFAVALPEALVDIAVGDVTIAKDALTFNIPVTVKNLRDNYAAKNVKVMIYDSSKCIGQATIETLEAGAEKTINVNVVVENAYTENTMLRAWATGFSETQTVEFKLIVSDTAGIKAIMEQLGNNAQIYTIGGKRLNTINKPGLYIINGKKTVVK